MCADCPFISRRAILRVSLDLERKALPTSNNFLTFIVTAPTNNIALKLLQWGKRELSEKQFSENPGFRPACLNDIVFSSKETFL